MNRPVPVFIAILAFFLLLRLLIFYSFKPEYKEGQYLSFKSTILNSPKFTGSYQNFSVQAPNGDTVFINTLGYPEYEYGENIAISGPIRILPRSTGLQPGATEGQSNGASNSKVHLLNNNYVYSMKFPKISLNKEKESPYLAVVNFIRQKIINVFQNVLPKDASSLMLGIVFGIKEDFSKEFLQGLKSVGVMHVIAASGMNVTMVGGFIFYLFSLIFKRQLAVGLSILAIIFYALLAGFGASVIRASIMGVIAFSAQIFGRQNNGFYALALTVIFMLLIWPMFLFDIGFQLSFLSTLGILYIPNLFKTGKNLLWQDLLTTFSAQAATLPVLLSNFGTYSLWSIVVNMLVLWTVPMLMVLGAVAAIVSFVFEPLARLILYLGLPFLLYFQAVASFFTSLNGKIVLEDIPWQFGASYYLLLASLLVFKLKTKSE